jgi:hypothetical protein
MMGVQAVSSREMRCLEDAGSREGGSPAMAHLSRDRTAAKMGHPVWLKMEHLVWIQVQVLVSGFRCGESCCGSV